MEKLQMKKTIRSFKTCIDHLGILSAALSLSLLGSMAMTTTTRGAQVLDFSAEGFQPSTGYLYSIGVVPPALAQCMGARKALKESTMPNGAKIVDFSETTQTASAYWTVTDAAAAAIYDKVGLAGGSKANFSTNPKFTFVFVINIDPKKIAEGSFSAIFAGSGENKLAIHFNSNGTWDLQSTSDTTSDSGAPYTAEWAVYALSYDGATVKYYKNGVEIGSVASTQTFTVMNIAQMCSDHQAKEQGRNNCFLGQFATLQAYDTVLTPAEIAAKSKELAATCGVAPANP